ncbi:MAG: thiaminase II [Desulfurococcales archaeon]|nr:thiaminase II [Desulfurococcales archaeon]
MARLTETLYRSAEHIWEKIVSHPFVLELYSGKLPVEKFKFYVVQDYNYLIGMMRTFSLIAAKADPETAALALEIAHADATVEMENYKRLLPRLGLTLEQVIATEPAPTNVAYMNYLITTAALGTPLEGLVAVLPCFWSYQYIAERLKDALKDNPNPLYREWAQVYLSREYKDLVDRLKEAADKLFEEEGGRLSILKKIFVTGSRYEYMFWDMAYRIERWPI